MEIEKIVSLIRKSDIGNIMYKVKPAANFLGVYGLKTRPKDIEFLETGTLIDIDNVSTIKKSYNLFRTFIPKDFAVVNVPKYWTKTNDNTMYPINEYHLIDIDIYTYLLAAEGLRSKSIPLGSTPYVDLFYLDGREVDYTDSLLKNMYIYSLILSDKSNLIPYIYKKTNSSLFSELSAEDFLMTSHSFDASQLDSIFKEINIFSNIKNEI
jgi:hypothetical protein